MNPRALIAASGVVLLASAANTALNGMWAVSGMDAFADEWQRRLESAPSPPSRDEIFGSLNAFVGGRLARVLIWSLAVQGLAGAALLLAAVRMKPAPRSAEPAP